MKLSFCASENADMNEPVLFRGKYVDALRKAADCGMDGVEIHVRDAAEVDVKEIHHVCQETGVVISGVATGLAKRIDGLTLIDDDKEVRKATIRRLKGHLDLCDEFGCAALIGSVRGNILQTSQKNEIMKRLKEGIYELVQYIAHKSCFIEIEAINRFENNYLNTADEVSGFLQEFQSDKVKLLIDTFHMNIEEEDMLAPIIKNIGIINRIHFAENTRRSPGSGQIDFQAILDVLRKEKYTNWISFEYLPYPAEETALQKGLEFWKEINE